MGEWWRAGIKLERAVGESAEMEVVGGDEVGIRFRAVFAGLLLFQSNTPILTYQTVMLEMNYRTCPTATEMLITFCAKTPETTGKDSKTIEYAGFLDTQTFPPAFS